MEAEYGDVKEKKEYGWWNSTTVRKKRPKGKVGVGDQRSPTPTRILPEFSAGALASRQAQLCAWLVILEPSGIFG
jgi:hypothetical protein